MQLERAARIAAGELTARHGLGVPQYLSQQQFYFGINDVVSGDYRTGALFNNVVFSLYDAWNSSQSNGLANGDPVSTVEAAGRSLEVKRCSTPSPSRSVA